MDVLRLMQMLDSASSRNRNSSGNGPRSHYGSSHAPSRGHQLGAYGTLKARVETLNEENEAIKAENEAYLEERRKLRKRTLAMEKAITDLTAQNDIQKVTISDLREVNSERTDTIETLSAEIDKLKNDIAVRDEEQKEAQMKIAELEDKVKEMEMGNLDVSKFEDWNWTQIHLWIMSLEGGYFKKYEAVLREALSEDEFMGKDLFKADVVIKYWGIRDKKDRGRLIEHIQALVNPQPGDCGAEPIPTPPQNENGEGASTPYM